MEKNMFENAKYGDKYETRDGRKAVFVGIGEKFALFDVEGFVEGCVERCCVYPSDGRYSHWDSPQDLDIVRRF